VPDDIIIDLVVNQSFTCTYASIWLVSFFCLLSRAHTLKKRKNKEAEHISLYIYIYIYIYKSRYTDGGLS